MLNHVRRKYTGKLGSNTEEEGKAPQCNRLRIARGKHGA